MIIKAYGQPGQTPTYDTGREEDDLRVESLPDDWHLQEEVTLLHSLDGRRPPEISHV
jgi:hypothetical protein